MGLKSAEQALFFDAFFILLLGLYGVSTNSASLQSLQSIGSPTVTRPPSQGGCVPVVVLVWPVCLDSLLGSSGLAVATENIAWSILNIPALIFWAINVVLVFLNVVFALTFSPGFSANGIPIIGFFFVAVQLIILFEIFRFFRGTSTGF